MDPTSEHWKNMEQQQTCQKKQPRGPVHNRKGTRWRTITEAVALHVAKDSDCAMIESY